MNNRKNGILITLLLVGAFSQAIASPFGKKLLLTSSEETKKIQTITFENKAFTDEFEDAFNECFASTIQANLETSFHDLSPSFVQKEIKALLLEHPEMADLENSKDVMNFLKESISNNKKEINFHFHNLKKKVALFSSKKYEQSIKMVSKKSGDALVAIDMAKAAIKVITIINPDDTTTPFLNSCITFLEKIEHKIKVIRKESKKLHGKLSKAKL